ncbi:type II secretion system F family protein [Roseovarius aestuarii]|uniref:Bacterial type II secretion system protein F domain protein n=1 Tax=Roseovarius aestuarii TaxID=475083 RepID=A0A1X7BY11_9RHOB|nr:type II secretion system F family protein [Roseovarius aestuarii]SMC14462.1 Bacterial type II secretion system protein F domain protein [Roseovarius aestuarii]
MLEHLDKIALGLGITPETLVMVGFGFGAILIFLGFATLVTSRNPAAERMSAASAGDRYTARLNKGLLRPLSDKPGRIMKAFVPDDDAKRSQLQDKLAQAGYAGAGALWKFTLVRTVLALVLPALFLAVLFVGKMPGLMLPIELPDAITQLTTLQIFQVLTLLVGMGYFAPLYWLRGRVSERQLRVQEAFPNALDLMQISVDAGMGFDAAMTRVGNELVNVSPDIAFEFLTVQMQVQAGRSRDVAMHDMATRTGVETVRSFANVVQQSMQFGTSMSDALNTYSKEMRDYREMQAQEMANKLPVKMSAVLASLMLPALVLLTLGPVVIRYIRFYGG